MESKLIPKLRFKEYDSEWKAKTFKELGSVAMCKRIFKKQTTVQGDVPFYKIGTFGKTADSYISREIYEEYKEKYTYPKVGDVLLSASGTIGRTVIYDGEDAYFQDSNIIWFNAYKEPIDNSFLYQFYQIIKWKGLEGSTIKRLYNENVLSTNINLPSLQEQKKIGLLFKNLDETISLHQQELDALKQTKQGFLQKMFPEEGGNVPEIRFEGFSGEWESKTFSLLVNRTSKQSNSDILPKLEFEDIISGEGKLNKDISNKFDNRKGILFEPGYILFGKLRPYLKNWLLPNFKGIALGDFWVFATQQSPEFIYTLIQTQQFQLVANLSTGTKMPRSDWKTVSSTHFLIPSIEEQVKIGEFFKQLDEVIELKDQEIEALKQMKKGFLQKMFV